MQKTYTIYDKLSKTELDEEFTGGLDAQFDAEDYVKALAKEEGRDRDDYDIFVSFPLPAAADIHQRMRDAMREEYDTLGRYAAETAGILRQARRIRAGTEEMLAELAAIDAADYEATTMSLLRDLRKEVA